jgi:hypothetical protein
MGKFVRNGEPREMPKPGMKMSGKPDKLLLESKRGGEFSNVRKR